MLNHSLFARFCKGETDIPLTLAVFLRAHSILPVAFSLMPGGHEAVMVAQLEQAGMPFAHCIAATVLIRLAMLSLAAEVDGVMLPRSGKAGAG